MEGKLTVFQNSMLQLIKSQKGALSKQEATDVEHFKRLEKLENEFVSEERV